MTSKITEQLPSIAGLLDSDVALRHATEDADREWNGCVAYAGHQGLEQAQARAFKLSIFDLSSRDPLTADEETLADLEAYYHFRDAVVQILKLLVRRTKEPGSGVTPDVLAATTEELRVWLTRDLPESMQDWLAGVLANPATSTADL